MEKRRGKQMRIEQSFVLREVAGEYVIVPTGKAAMEFNGMITVNETGAFLWDQLSAERTIEELAEAVFQEYEVDRETAVKDTEEFIGLLQKYKILE